MGFFPKLNLLKPEADGFIFITENLRSIGIFGVQARANIKNGKQKDVWGGEAVEGRVHLTFYVLLFWQHCIILKNGWNIMMWLFPFGFYFR